MALITFTRDGFRFGKPVRTGIHKDIRQPIWIQHRRNKTKKRRPTLNK